MPNVVKIGAKINTMQNINILLFVYLTVLNKLKALQLSTVALSTIKHQRLLDNSQIRQLADCQLADWTTRGLDISRTGQFAD